MLAVSMGNIMRQTSNSSPFLEKQVLLLHWRVERHWYQQPNQKLLTPNAAFTTPVIVLQKKKIGLFLRAEKSVPADLESYIGVTVHDTIGQTLHFQGQESLKDSLLLAHFRWVWEADYVVRLPAALSCRSCTTAYGVLKSPSRGRLVVIWIF